MIRFTKFFSEINVATIQRKTFIKMKFATDNKNTIAERINALNPNKVQPYNLTPKIIDLCSRRLFSHPAHPLTILKHKIQAAIDKDFKIFDDIDPIVTVDQNFEVLNIQKSHSSRQKTDTFYINEEYILRTHTTAHQKDILSKGISKFITFGDVYRRDQIDKYHYPAFHQMQAVKIMGKVGSISVEEIANDLKKNLEIIVKALYGQCQMRWIDAYFPFTHPSFQLEIYHNEKWVEMLGCGVLHPKVMERAGRGGQTGWAAGLGLQRFAMRLFKIPDVRLFWSEDPRFISQFTPGQITEFKQYSKYPHCFKDISMFIKPEYNSNNLFSLMRQIGGDLIESVEQVQTYVNPKTNKTSKMYRIYYRSLEKTLTNKEIDQLHFAIRDKIKNQLDEVQLR